MLPWDLPGHWVTALGPELRKPKASPVLQPHCSEKIRGFPRIPQARKGLCPSASEETADNRGCPKPCFSALLLLSPELRAAGPWDTCWMLIPSEMHSYLRESPRNRPGDRLSPSALPGKGGGAAAEEELALAPSRHSVFPQRSPYLRQLGAPLLRAIAAVFPPHGQPSHRSQESCQEDESEDEHDFPSNQRHLSLPLSPPRASRTGGLAPRPPSMLQILSSERSSKDVNIYIYIYIYMYINHRSREARCPAARAGSAGRATPLPLIALAVCRALSAAAAPPARLPVLMLKGNSEKLHKCVRGGREGGRERASAPHPTS